MGGEGEINVVGNIATKDTWWNSKELFHDVSSTLLKKDSSALLYTKGKMVNIRTKIN